MAILVIGSSTAGKATPAAVLNDEGSTGIQVPMEPGSDFVATLRRWEDAGGVWRVLGRDLEAITVGLYRCDGGEEVDRFVARDPRVAQFLVGRTSSQDQQGTTSRVPAMDADEEGPTET